MFERLAFLQSETVRFGNNRDDIDDLTKFFHHSHVYGAERMAGRVDKVQAAVDTRVLDVTVTHRRELLAKVRAVLVLDILHNWVPATTLTVPRVKTSSLKTGTGRCDAPVFVVHLVTIARSIDDVKTQSHPVLRDN